MRSLTVIFFILSFKFYSQEIPQLDTFSLKNGLKIYLLHYGEDSTLSARLIINAGKKTESTCQVGYSKVIGKFLSETIKTQARNLKTTNDVKFETREENTSLNFNCSTRELDKQLSLINSVIFRPAFKKDKIDQAISSVIDQYDPEHIELPMLSTAFRDLILYGSQDPLGRNYCLYQLHKALPIELNEFYTENYIPKNSSLLICGNFNVIELKKIISRHFEKWKASTKEVIPGNITSTKPGIKNKEICFINNYHSKNYLLKWMKLAPAKSSSEYPAFLISCYLFDQYLVNKLKEENLGKAKLLNFKPISHSTDFIEINCIAIKNDMANAIKLVDSTLKAFSISNFKEADLEEAIKKLTALYSNPNSSEAALLLYDPLLYNFNSRKFFPGNLSNHNIPEIQMMIKKYFSPDSYKLMIVGKEYPLSRQLNLIPNLKRYQTYDYETCDETCSNNIPKKKYTNHIYRPRINCRGCWKSGFHLIKRMKIRKIEKRNR